MIFRWIFREIKNNQKIAFLFCLNLALGLTGFLCLDAFKESLNASLQTNAKSFLSADLAVYVRRQLTTDEIATANKTVGSYSATGRLWEFFSMVASPNGSRLVQVKAVDSTYPLYGSIQLGSGALIEKSSEKEILKGDFVWAYPELLRQLNLKVGDDLVLGDRKFKIVDTITEDSSQTFRLASLAPRIYLSIASLQGSNLISFGTTMTDTLMYEISSSVSLPEKKKELEAQFSDPAIRTMTYHEAGEDSGRPLKYLSDYLGLVSLVALFLAALGTAYLFRNYLAQRTTQMAIWNALGLTKKKAQQIYLGQVLLLGFVSSTFSLLMAYLLLPLLAGILKTLTPFDIPLAVTTKTVLVAFLMGTVGSFVITMPFLRSIRRVQTQRLLLEDSELETSFQIQDLWVFLPALLLYWGLAIWQANSFKTGTYFVAIFLGALLVFFLVGLFLLSVLKYVPAKIWYIRQALLGLRRRRLMSLAVFVSLALGSLLMNLLPQVKVSLKQDLEQPANLKLPSLFMFDIQDDQIEPLQQLLAKNNVEAQHISPMVRGRILSINGENYERVQKGEFATREEEEEARSRNRGVNLSFREMLSSSETLVEGREFSGPYRGQGSEPAELSVERRYADRMGLKLGDLMKFDVQGVEVLGKVINFRNVKWNSFQPNFFILFQPGVLDEAPKTFLAALPPMENALRENVQDQIVQAFANVSMVDVLRLVERIMSISERMSWSLELMAALSLVAGFVVLYSMASQQVVSRRWDLNMMKILGASASSTRNYLLFEFWFLAFLATLFGIVVGFAASFTVSYLFFDGTYQFDLAWPLFTLVVVSLLSLGLTWLASHRVIQERPREILHGEE